MEETKSIFKNIWLVDDDEDDHLVFESAVKTVSPLAAVTHLYKCTELLSLLDQGKVPDLLFLDLHLPFMDGRTCLKHLSETNKISLLKTLVYSGSNYAHDINNSYKHGAVLYLIKPLTFNGLVITLQHIFGLDWDEPKTITDNHKIGERFVPYRAG